MARLPKILIVSLCDSGYAGKLDRPRLVNKPQHPIDAYMRFLRLSASIHEMQVLDPNGRVLFERILLAWAQEKPLTVSEAIGIKQLGGSATLHKRLSCLRDMELIDAVRVGDDRRTKRLVPTSKGLVHVEKLGKALVTSIDT